MAKKPKANQAERSTRNAIIALAVLIFAVGVGLVINNRTLSSIGTVGGQRVPTEHYRFMLNQQFNQFAFQFWQVDPEILNPIIRDAAWDETVNFTVMVQRAQELGLELTPEQEAEAREDAQAFIDSDDDGFLRSLGFSNRNFMDFMMDFALLEVLFEHTTAEIYISEAERAQAFFEYLELIRQWPHAPDFYSVFVHAIEVEDRMTADMINQEFFVTMDFVDLLRRFCINYNPDELPVVDGVPIYFVDIFDTNANEMVLIQAFHLLEAGHMGGVTELDNGNYMLFQIVHVAHPDYDELWEDFIVNHDNMVRENHFMDSVQRWVQQTNINRNNRAFNMF
ncbi:MAG: SurA N-terminal domain-containing protein [Defluviitaleaceae bacterium]|nr:SurA N-terminal domain-containing protein [Defluviitaleaceae bacterium]